MVANLFKGLTTGQFDGNLFANQLYLAVLMQLTNGYITISTLLNIPQLIINNIETNCDITKIYALVRGKRPQCPICGKYSNAVHDHYDRQIRLTYAINLLSKIFLKNK